MNHIRIALLTAGAVLGLASGIAGAQPAPPPPPGADRGNWQGSWQGQWDAPDNRVYRGTWSGTFERGMGPNAEIDGPPPYPGHDDDYRRMVERCSTDHRSGKVIGGVVGGIVGGVVGNRLADGNRTLGTVVGAGAGAIGGAAVGAAIDRGHDRECENFFRSAGPDSGYLMGPGWSPPPGYVWVPVVSSRSGTSARGYIETVTTTEEFVDSDRKSSGSRNRVIYKPAHRRPPPRIHDKRVYIGGS